MRIELPDHTNTFVGVRVALTPGDLQRLIDRLGSLASSPDQHFHLTSDDGGVFIDLEVGVQGVAEPSNAAMSGFAIDPDGG